ncbi:MAG: IS66 family insertion sequence element accessory protein TnpB, partial [Tannerellaceae bacterium]|nr:IS66 family insertion sequence element accessory protein TnpB [Tannerellaceae bacterium]
TFEKIYERYQSSGLSVRDFCSNEGLHEAKFYYWQKKIAKAPIQGFVPFVIEGSADKEDFPVPFSSPSAAAPGCELTYPDGTRLTLSGRVDFELLRSLLLLKR